MYIAKTALARFFEFRVKSYEFRVGIFDRRNTQNGITQNSEFITQNS